MAKFGRNPLFTGFLVQAYLKAGDARRAEAAYAEMRARSEVDVVSRGALASAAAIIDRSDDAIRFAVESVERCDGLDPVWTRLPFATDSIRPHPRYPKLLRAMGM